MILTKSPYGYELLTSDNRHYIIVRQNGKVVYHKTNLNKVEQMCGELVHGIPNEIKSIVFKLQKNEDR